MATKTIAWTTGSGNITLTYTGQGNGSISVASDENTDFEPRQQSFKVVTTNGTPEQAIDILVKQAGKTYPVGEVFNFDYTGSVQQITLPKGKYKLQCWGAQGGTSYGSSNGVGSKGGYSEGVLTLSETTTLYVFVGGKGSRGSGSSLINGGWNGGGASIGHSSYTSGNTTGQSYPACGGGATDISTVTSSMSYSSGRNNRSAASLLARCIVAGGGAGGSWRHTSVTTTSEPTTTTSWSTVNSGGVSYSYQSGSNYVYVSSNFTLENGVTYKFAASGSNWGTVTACNLNYYDSAGTYVGAVGNYKEFTGNSAYTYRVQLIATTKTDGGTSWRVDKKVTTTVPGETTTSTSSGYSNQSQQGGGTSGKGQFPGTQSAAGSGSNAGGFGYGANQDDTGYRYLAGAGGGGWYGGGCSTSDSSTAAINYTGGGSGFVNTAANASYRPSGYTGLQLDSGETIAGNTSHPSTSGGTETGHSGNGYARITVI